MRKNSPNLYLINNPRFNSMFGTGESCQQKLWSLVPHPPAGHENTQPGIAAVSAISNLSGERGPFLLNPPGLCPAKWGVGDHQFYQRTNQHPAKHPLLSCTLHPARLVPQDRWGAGSPGLPQIFDGHILWTWHPGRAVSGDTDGEAVGTDMVFPKRCSLLAHHASLATHLCCCVFWG